jgi:hypothetical protein
VERVDRGRVLHRAVFTPSMYRREVSRMRPGIHDTSIRPNLPCLLDPDNLPSSTFEGSSETDLSEDLI